MFCIHSTPNLNSELCLKSVCSPIYP